MKVVTQYNIVLTYEEKNALSICEDILSEIPFAMVKDSTGLDTSEWHKAVNFIKKLSKNGGE